MGTTYVKPEHRGRGLATAMVMVHEDRYRLKDAHLAAHPDDLLGADSLLCQHLYPGLYSEGGFRTRLEVHRRQVERALDEGMEVPEEVLADYGRDGNGRLVRTTPWGLDEQRDWAAGTDPRKPDAEADVPVEDDLPSP